MTSKEIKSIVEKRQISIGFSSLWNQLIPLTFIFYIPAILGLVVLGSEASKGIYWGFGMKMTLVFLVPSVLSIRKLTSNKKIERIPFEVRFDNVVIACLCLGWHITRKEDGFIEANTKTSLLSWGETVRIFLYKDHAYVNSIGRGPFTFGRNRKNISELKHELRNREI